MVSSGSVGRYLVPKYRYPPSPPRGSAAKTRQSQGPWSTWVSRAWLGDPGSGDCFPTRNLWFSLSRCSRRAWILPASGRDPLESELLASVHTPSGWTFLGKEGGGPYRGPGRCRAPPLWVPRQGSPTGFPLEHESSCIQGCVVLFRALNDS